MNYRRCASVIQGTAHRMNRSKSYWEQFNEAVEAKKAQGLINQYHEIWSEEVAADDL